MREKEAVNLALQDFFTKISLKLGKPHILTYLKVEPATGTLPTATQPIPTNNQPFTILVKTSYNEYD